MCHRSALDLLQSPTNMSFLWMVMLIIVVTQNTRAGIDWHTAESRCWCSTISLIAKPCNPPSTLWMFFPTNSTVQEKEFVVVAARRCTVKSECSGIHPLKGFDYCSLFVDTPQSLPSFPVFHLNSLKHEHRVLIKLCYGSNMIVSLQEVPTRTTGMFLYFYTHNLL